MNSDGESKGGAAVTSSGTMEGVASSQVLPTPPPSPPRPMICYGRILLGEITPLLAAMKRSTPRWSAHQQDMERDPLVVKLKELRTSVTSLGPDDTMDPSTFLDPFLSIIRSEDTTGPVTKSALAAVNRMLSYGLITEECSSAASAVEAVAAAVTHARFVGTDQGADEVVLWEILTVLRTLMLGPAGHLLTNESVCEILNSSFRICFETRLSELLRNCTEDALRHMVQLLFARLPQFKDDPRGQGQAKRLKMRAGGEGKGRRRGKSPRPTPSSTPPPPEPPPSAEVPEEEEAEEEEEEEEADAGVKEEAEEEAEEEEADAGVKEEASPAAVVSPCESEPESIGSAAVGDTASVDSGVVEPICPISLKVDISNAHLAPDNCSSMENLASPVTETDGGQCTKGGDVELLESISGECLETDTSQSSVEAAANRGNPESEPSEPSPPRPEDLLQAEKEDFINAQGVKFTQEGVSVEGGALVPYGMPCVREVFRFLISLTSPTNEQNTPSMILTALNLLTVGLEVGAHHINHTTSLITLLKDQLCRNLFLLLKPEHRLGIFMASLRICTLFCESLRTHFKFQIEMFLDKLTEIVTSETAGVTYAHKELALETIVQLWRIPGLITELFLNYDCDLYASNLFEDLTKVLSKNAFPVQGLYSTNLLSLEALFTVIETIEGHGRAGNAKPSDASRDPKGVPLVVAPVSSGYLLGLGLRGGFCPVTPRLKARSVLTDDRTVSREHLVALKEKKKLLAAGTDQFNAKPDRGIKFLQDNGIIGQTNEDVALFLRENPRLCKKMIGELVSRKKNMDILSAFVRSFEFRALRVDEALRTFLESFRLPGEAPLISIIIEHFSSHWHLSNEEPFGKEDAAFTLAYAIIMLNVDQHNQNAKKQNVPMTLDQFRNNLRGVNDGADFDPDMLEEIYDAIRLDEIVMPSEHTGPVRENYLWKMLLKRGATKEGRYVLANGNTAFDRDLFALSWGPTIASLSYVFDKSSDDAIVQRAVSGFRKCASISARYGMSDVFDNLVVSLCKFTTLTASSGEAPEHVTASFGANKKAQLAARTVLGLATSHGDILRDGWKNILDLLLQLFRCRLLPSTLAESEDFVETGGRVSLLRETPAAVPRVESGLLSSLYSYISLGDAGTTRGADPEDAELSRRARTCILECRPEKLVTESAFLRCDSLHELLKAMMGAGDASTLGEAGVGSRGGPTEGGPGGGLDEHSQAFLLELVIQVLVANKDRALGVWPGVRNHIYALLMGAAAADRQFLLERCVVAMLRLAKVLLRRPNLANPILQGFRMLLLLRPSVLLRISLQVVCGLREVLSVNTDHIQDPNDWAVLFNLLECAGAGAKPPPIVNSEQADATSDAGSLSDSDMGSTSGIDSGHCTEGGASDSAEPSSPMAAPEHTEGVGREGEIEPVAVRAVAVNEWDIVHQRQLGEHRPEALVQAVDTLMFLVRDRRITHSSLPSAVQACRTFVEATLHGGQTEKRSAQKESLRSPSRRKTGGRRKDDKTTSRRPKSPTNGPNAYDADESDSDDVPMTYQQVSEKLLDLMDTLHTASSEIVGLGDQSTNHQASSPSLWPQALCPLLQGIARYCCDSRATIRNMAMTYLQRALLNHDLQALSAGEWEACFNKVLFPLLAKLLQPLPGSSPASLEETRVRAATLVQKSDAIPEILKNMLLVMETTQVFHTADGFTRLWTITWDRIDAFLPDFRHNLFRSHPPSEIHKIEVVPSETTTKSPSSSHPTTPDGSRVSTGPQGTPSATSCTPETLPQAATDVDPASPTADGGAEPFAPPTLREQQAASNAVILQPPLPTLLPVNFTPPASLTAATTSSSPQMLSTTPLAGGSLIASPVPPALPHLAPSPPPPPQVDPPKPLPPIFRVEPPTPPTSSRNDGRRSSSPPVHRPVDPSFPHTPTTTPHTPTTTPHTTPHTPIPPSEACIHLNQDELATSTSHDTLDSSVSSSRPKQVSGPSTQHERVQNASPCHPEAYQYTPTHPTPHRMTNVASEFPPTNLLNQPMQTNLSFDQMPTNAQYHPMQTNTHTNAPFDSTPTNAHYYPMQANAPFDSTPTNAHYYPMQANAPFESTPTNAHYYPMQANAPFDSTPTNAHYYPMQANAPFHHTPTLPDTINGSFPLPLTTTHPDTHPNTHPDMHPDTHTHDPNALNVTGSYIPNDVNKPATTQITSNDVSLTTYADTTTTTAITTTTTTTAITTTTTTTTKPGSIFPLSLPSFLNPFAVEVDVELEAAAGDVDPRPSAVDPVTVEPSSSSSSSSPGHDSASYVVKGSESSE
ncbi:Golgi-specific brefeldin A-resistance guanine nucleotide exchange factor 1-like [Homarus americanus]|uniref:Golgi-specific brefeldin A-resistance guanine nucleotide exchange factor 1-like n=1 Tax=Homarus americanus TaxID=6706 RepID=A0A8J5JHZ4_HOMAM|nr:Golgi-specific brefeldin A-resistance guanine nucleotide exchange factor 1-like [Homarus americanus]